MSCMSVPMSVFVSVYKYDIITHKLPTTLATVVTR